MLPKVTLASLTIGRRHGEYLASWYLESDYSPTTQSLFSDRRNHKSPRLCTLHLAKSQTSGVGLILDCVGGSRGVGRDHVIIGLVRRTGASTVQPHLPSRSRLVDYCVHTQWALEGGHFATTDLKDVCGSTVVILF